jgi:putative FmdB family regulatory protein
MPLYDFQCPQCQHTFEELVRVGDTPSCPQCGSTKPERLLSVAGVAPGRTQATLAAVRQQASREGHLSHYSRAERRKLLR